MAGNREEARRGRSGRRRSGSASARKGRSGEFDGPHSPDSWRDIVRGDYEYPSDLTGLRGRDRRRARREWRRDDHAQRMAWLREQRQAEPASPAGVLAVVIVLAIVVLGIGGGLPRILGDGGGGEQPISLLTPSDPVPRPDESTLSRSPDVPTNSASSGPTSVPPVETKRPPAAAASVASHVVNNWAHRFYSRNPVTESYEQLVARSAEYTTPELATSFVAAGDSTYDALKAAGGTSKVVAAPVTTPREGTAPVDTPTRISRFVNIVIDITGQQPRRINVPLLVTVIPRDAKWVISDVSGGTGP